MRVLPRWLTRLACCLVLTLSTATRLLAQARPRIDGRAVRLDAEGKLLSWVNPQESAYGHVVKLAWDFILNKVPEESNGLRTYLTHSSFDPATLHGTDWPHNPARLYALFVESALAYYAYSGNSSVLDRVRQMLDHQLVHGSTPATWEWASVPYASSDPGSLDYSGADDTRHCRQMQDRDHCGRGDGRFVVEPDKIAELGVGYLKFFELTGEEKYRDAALACANALASHVRPGDLIHSPWPFRVFAHTNLAREEYSAQVIAAIKLFDELARAGLNHAAYSRARRMAWEWLERFPLRNGLWSAYFEDAPIDTNLENWNQYSALETARYLLQHPETDPEWPAHAISLISWAEKTFAVDVKASEHYRWVQEEPVQYGRQWGANVLSGQTQDNPDKMGSHTARYASVCALYYEKTGEEAFKDRAFRSFNWATYMAQEDGLVTAALAEDNFTYTDGYADYIRHFLLGMGSVPEWAPPNETHLLRSTSVVQRISYGPAEVRYTTFDGDATEVLRLAFSPTRVTAGETALQQRSDLSQPGWVFDAAKGVLRVRHQRARDVTISSQ